MTLMDSITNWMTIQKNKHDFSETFESDTVNQMTNFELLEAISRALEEAGVMK